MGMFFNTQAVASEINVPGESSHLVGGTVIAAASTAVADRYWPEHRALIGFSISTIFIIAAEGIQMTRGEKFSYSLLDVASHTCGAAMGSMVTDRFILMPIVKQDSTGSTYIGIAVQHSF